MNIEYSDIRMDIVSYKIIGDVIYCNYGGSVYKADFSSFKDGKMVESNVEFISFAFKKDGVLNITLRRAVDVNGNEIPQDDFSTDIYEEVEIKWKTQEEIDREKNQPQPPTAEERLKITEDTILDLMTTIAMLGGM